MADRCWDYNQICAQHARRFSLRLDLRMPGAWKRVDELLAKHRPGQTRIRLHVLRSDASGCSTSTAVMLCRWMRSWWEYCGGAWGSSREVGAAVLGIDDTFAVLSDNTATCDDIFWITR